MTLAVSALLSALLGCSMLLTSVISRGGCESYGLPWTAGETIAGWFSDATVAEWIPAVCCALLFFLVFSSVLYNQTRWIAYLCRFRFILAAGLFIICILLEINNTSLYEWTAHLGLHGNGENAPFWGVARAIRMDEWAVWSPFVFSQSAAGYPAVNPLIGSGMIDTAWISVGGVPALSPAAPFKPFYWGFLLLGLSRGFSFLFAARFLGLFLVSYELANYYTRRSPALSFSAALLITFCPYVQWWFSQSIAEILIFGQAIVLCALRYCATSREHSLKRLLWSVFASWCFGCLAMVAYPSWLIAAAYLLFPVLILILARSRKNLRKKDLLALLPFAAVLAWLILLLLRSGTTLNAVKNSEYPGKRLITGGDPNLNSFSGLFSILLPYINPVTHNSCESAGWITLAPAGALLALYDMISKKKADSLSIILLGVELVLSAFIYFGVPAWFARITLLFQANRPEPALAIADTVLLLRGLSNRNNIPFWLRILFSILCTAFGVFMISRQFEPDHFIWILLGIISFASCMIIFSVQKKKPQTLRLAACLFCTLALLGGAFVNPLQQGIRCAEDLDLIRAIRDTPDEEPDAVWFMAADYPLSNLPLLAGKHVLNATQPYPDPDFWSVIDPQGEYRPLYNRFCHVAGYLSDEQFEIGQSAFDYIWISLTGQELRELRVSYVVTALDIPENWQDIQWIRKGSADGYHIYLLRY